MIDLSEKPRIRFNPIGPHVSVCRGKLNQPRIPAETIRYQTTGRRAAKRVKNVAPTRATGEDATLGERGRHRGEVGALKWSTGKIPDVAAISGFVLLALLLAVASAARNARFSFNEGRASSAFDSFLRNRRCVVEIA